MLNILPLESDDDDDDDDDDDWLYALPYPLSLLLLCLLDVCWLSAMRPLNGCCGPTKENMLNILPLESDDDDDDDDWDIDEWETCLVGSTYLFSLLELLLLVVALEVETVVAKEVLGAEVSTS